MLKGKIKITNVSNHIHGIKEDRRGRVVWKKIQPKASIYISEETFFDLWNDTKDFTRGILSLDVAKFIEDFGEETAFAFGIIEEEIKENTFMYTDEQINKFLKGKMGEFNSFMAEIKDAEGNDKHSFMKRVFDLATKIENLNITKANKIEKDFGMTFDAFDEQ